jgi:hypothetical protein
MSAYYCQINKYFNQYSFSIEQNIINTFMFYLLTSINFIYFKTIGLKKYLNIDEL